jgi:hypothetical protein
MDSDGLQAGRPGFDSRQTQEIFSLLHSLHTGCEAHPASYPMGTGALSPGEKRPGREVDLSYSSSAEVKNGGAILPLNQPFSWRGV